MPKYKKTQFTQGHGMVESPLRRPANSALTGELGTLRSLSNPSNQRSTEVSITVTDKRLNFGHPTNIPSLVKGQVGVPHIVKNVDVTPIQTEHAIRRAAERVKKGASLPAYATIADAEKAAKYRSRNKKRR